MIASYWQTEKTGEAFSAIFCRHCPAVMGKAATENIAVFIIKKIEIAILRFQIFYIRILHGNAPYRFFITVYAGKGKCIIKKTGKELLFCGNYGMFEIGKAERGIFMSMLDTFRMSGTLYVCAIILVMLLIYAAICYLEWRLAQKRGMVEGNDSADRFSAAWQRRSISRDYFIGDLWASAE